MIIITAETNGLRQENTNYKWEAVRGSERMSKFGIYNTLDALSDKDATKYKYYLNMKYSEVFTVLLMRKTQYEIQQDIDNLKTK